MARVRYLDFGYGGWLLNSSEVILNNFKSAHVFHQMQKTNGSEKKKQPSLVGVDGLLVG